MKAVVFQNDSLSFAIEEKSTPVPGTGEVLVCLHAAALNRRDYSTMLNEQNRKARNFVFGADGAGVVEALGEGVEGWQVGDEVIIYPGTSCGHCEFCLTGRHSVCSQFQTLGGIRQDGTFAEYVKVFATQLAKKPVHLNFEEAAALPLALGTAWRSLMTRAELQPGETLLIHGIGGGVAILGLQIATQMGVRVIVTSGSDKKLQRAKTLGADVCINYKKEDVLQRVLEVTNGEGADVVLDGVGKDTLELSIAAARRNGRIVYYGNNREWNEERPLIYPSPIWFKQLSFLGTGMFSPIEFKQAIQFVNQTKLVPVISEVLPLDQVGAAFEQLKQHQQFGKLVLAIG